MVAINRLNIVQQLEDKDIFPIWDADSGRTRAVLAEQIKSYFTPDHDIHLVSGSYSAGKLSLTMSDGTVIEVPGWTDLTGLDILDDGGSVGKFDRVNFKGNGIRAAASGTTLEVEVDKSALAPTLSLHFAGIYDDLQGLQDAISHPTDNMQAIVINPSEKYYHGVGGSWVELAPVGSFHPLYLGAYDTVQDLQTANPTPASDSLAIVGTTSKQFYLYDGAKWDPLPHTDLLSLAARVTDAEGRIGVAEQHLQTLQSDAAGQDNKISALETGQQTLQSNIDQKISGVHLEDVDGNAFDGINGIVFDGAEVQDDQGTKTSHVLIKPKITVANGQTPSSTSEVGNAIIFPGATITPDPSDANVLTVSIPTGQLESKLSVGDAATASREVTTLLFPGAEAYGSGNDAYIQIKFSHFATIAERDAWASKFKTHILHDMVAVVDTDENGFVQWYRFDAQLKQWKDYNAQGVVMSDSDGAIPKNIKTVVFGPGFAIQQAGDQEDAALVTYQDSGSHTHEAALSVGQSWGDYHIVNKVDDIETRWPIEVATGKKNPTDPEEGTAILTIKPGVYELAHSKSCLLKLDMPMSVPGQLPDTIYMSEEIVPPGSFFSLNQAERGIDVQDNTGGDTAVTGGEMTEVLAYVTFFGNATQDGNIKLWAEYKDPADPIAKKILEDVYGNPLVVEKNFASGNPLGSLLLSGAFMAKATQPFKIVVETSFDTTEKVVIDPQNTMVCLNQFGEGYETSVARIEFQRRAGISIIPSIENFKTDMLMLSDELIGMNIPEQVIAANEGEDVLNEFGIQNLTEIKASIDSSGLSINDNGNVADFYVDCLISNTQTRMLRGKEISTTINIQNPYDSFEFEAYYWNGKPDEVTKIYSSRNNGSIVLNVGWTVIKGEFIAENPQDSVRPHLMTFTVPNEANNIAIIVRPSSAQSPIRLFLPEFKWGVTTPSTGFTEVSRSHVREEHLAYSENYSEWLLGVGGYESLRYTINAAAQGNPMPVGTLAKGKAPVAIDRTVNQVSGSSVPQYDGALKFTKDGEASISKTYRVMNETGTDNTVTFWDVLFDVDGNESKIAESEKTFTIKANTAYPGVLFTIPAYAVDVETGQRVGGRAKSSKNDGAFVETKSKTEYLVQTIVDFKELVTTSSDDPDLISAAIPKALAFDRRVYSFTGNSLQNIVIPLTIPSDVELAEIEVVKQSGTVYTSVRDCEYAYDSSTNQLTVHVGQGVTAGKVYLSFWSGIA